MIVCIQGQYQCFYHKLLFGKKTCGQALTVHVFYLGNWLYFYLRSKYFQFHENLLIAPSSSTFELNTQPCIEHVSRWTRDKTPSDTGNVSDLTSMLCYLFTHFFPARTHVYTLALRRAFVISLTHSRTHASTHACTLQ